MIIYQWKQHLYVGFNNIYEDMFDNKQDKEDVRKDKAKQDMQTNEIFIGV